MKRVYQVYDGHGKKFRKVRVREPKDAPTATHWIWWQHGYLSYNPGEEGNCLPCDQTIEFPVKRLS